MHMELWAVSGNSHLRTIGFYQGLCRQDTPSRGSGTQSTNKLIMTNVPQQAPAGSVLHPPSRYGARLRHDANTLQRDSDSQSMGQASWLQDALPKRSGGWVTITMWTACHYHVPTNPHLKSFILPLFPTIWTMASRNMI